MKKKKISELIEEYFGIELYEYQKIFIYNCDKTDINKSLYKRILK